MIARVYHGRLFLTFLALFILVLSCSPALAGTYTETFSGPLNPRIWEVFTSGIGETVEVKDGRLVIKIPAVPGDHPYYAGIRSKFNHGQPCEAVVDFDLVTWPAWNNKAAGIIYEHMYVARTLVNDYWLGPHWFERAFVWFHVNIYQVNMAPEGVQGGHAGITAVILCR